MTCAVITAALTDPATLPGSLRYGVEQAVDASARFWLWTWHEPTDVLDHPEADWWLGPVEPAWPTGGGEVPTAPLTIAPGPEPRVDQPVPGFNLARSIAAPLVYSFSHALDRLDARGFLGIIGRCCREAVRRGW
jgi:hypothetical protein